MDVNEKISNILLFIILTLIITFVICSIWRLIESVKEEEKKEQYYTNLLLENERLKTIQEMKE